MPNYEYKCTAEGTRFEIWQEVGAEAPPCPDCGAPSKKVFQPPRVIFKGSGFYLTDLRAEKSGGSNAPEPSASTGSSPSTETKIESKPEAAPASTSTTKSE